MKAQDHFTLDVQFQDDVSLLNRGVPGFSDQSIKKGFIRWEQARSAFCAPHFDPPFTFFMLFCFRRKVYGILTVQVLFTFAMCAVFMLVQPVQNWTIRNTWIMWVALVLSIVIMFPMFHWKKEYPRNMICLGQNPSLLPLPLLPPRHACSPLQPCSPCSSRIRWLWCAAYMRRRAMPTQVCFIAALPHRIPCLSSAIKCCS